MANETKKIAFKWSPTFPNSFPWGKFDSPQEKKLARPTCCCRNQQRRVSIDVDPYILLKDQDIY
jgi:hypothetical protein